MSENSAYTEIPFESGATHRIKEKLKAIPKINQERPCSTCAHNYRYRVIRCGLQASLCDFYHSGYKPISEASKNRRKKKSEESGYERY